MKKSNLKGVVLYSSLVLSSVLVFSACSGEQKLGSVDTHMSGKISFKKTLSDIQSKKVVLDDKERMLDQSFIESNKGLAIGSSELQLGNSLVGDIQVNGVSDTSEVFDDSKSSFDSFLEASVIQSDGPYPGYGMPGTIMTDPMKVDKSKTFPGSEVKYDFVETNKLSDKIYVMKRTGKSSSFVVVESNGRYGLIDAGTGNFDKDYQNDVQFLSNLGVKKFDFVFLSHLDGDHTNYVDSNTSDVYGQKNPWILNNYEIGKVILKNQATSYASNVKNTYLNLTKTLSTRGISYGFEDNFKLGDFNFKVYNQDGASQNELNVYKTQIQSGKPFNIDQNLESLGLVAEKNGYRMYFGGDTILWDEAETAKEVGNVDVVVVPHHGNIDGVSQLGANALDPEVSIVSNSYENNDREFTYKSVHEDERKTVNISERTNQYYGDNVGADVYWTGDTGTATVDFTDTYNGISVSTSETDMSSQVVHEDVNIKPFIEPTVALDTTNIDEHTVETNEFASGME